MPPLWVLERRDGVFLKSPHISLEPMIPSGLKTMVATRTPPYMSMRYCDIGRNSSVTRVITTEARSVPLSDPSPPKTTTEVSSVDFVISNITGWINVINPANSAPAMPQ